MCLTETFFMSKLGTAWDAYLRLALLLLVILPLVFDAFTFKINIPILLQMKA